MISRGFGKNNNIVARGFGSTIVIDAWREIIRFSIYLKKLVTFDHTL